MGSGAILFPAKPHRLGAIIVLQNVRKRSKDSIIYVKRYTETTRKRHENDTKKAYQFPFQNPESFLTLAALGMRGRPGGRHAASANRLQVLTHRLRVPLPTFAMRRVIAARYTLLVSESYLRFDRMRSRTVYEHDPIDMHERMSPPRRPPPPALRSPVPPALALPRAALSRGRHASRRR